MKSVSQVGQTTAFRDSVARSNEERERVGNRLFVGNLSWDATEDELRSFLGDSVVNVKIVTDRDTGRSRGFAFVETTDAEAAQEVMRIQHGAIFMGRDLRINEAHERPSGGGGGGYRSRPSPSQDRSPPDRSSKGGGSRRRRDRDTYDY